MDEITDITKAWVELYDDKSYTDRKLTVRYPRSVAQFNNETSDDGKKGFGDKSSSAKWLIPRGWQAVLFDDANFKDSKFVLSGTGRVEENPDFGSFSDKCSSLRWEQT